MKYTIKMYRYYGMLGHEGEPVYSPYKVNGEIMEEGYVEIDIPHEIYCADDHTPIINVNGAPSPLSECLNTEKDNPVILVNEGGKYPTKYPLKWIDEYAHQIKTARTALNLTQQQLGERCGYTGTNAQKHVQRWEAGVKPVPRDKVQTVAKALNIDPMELL